MKNSHRYSNRFSSSSLTREDKQNIAIPLVSTTRNTCHSHSLSRSADRLNSKAHRRELRYEEHHDYIPVSLKSSSHRRSEQIELINHQTTRPFSSRPYSSHIPIEFSSFHFDMSRRTADQESSYGRLSECHSPLIPLENSAVKAPRRIESAYSQFPTNSGTTQEPVYANTQSLYDNILYPTGSKVSGRTENKSCASQTQLTWTMATFSSFVDLENQSIIIPQTDPTTLYSIIPPSTIEQQIKRVSPNVSPIFLFSFENFLLFSCRYSIQKS